MPSIVLWMWNPFHPTPPFSSFLADHIFYFVVSILFTFFPSCLYSVVILFDPSVTRKRRKALLYPCIVRSSSRARATLKKFQNDDIDTGGEHSKRNIKSKHKKNMKKSFGPRGEYTGAIRNFRELRPKDESNHMLHRR